MKGAMIALIGQGPILITNNMWQSMTLKKNIDIYAKVHLIRSLKSTERKVYIQPFTHDFAQEMVTSSVLGQN